MRTPGRPSSEKGGVRRPCRRSRSMRFARIGWRPPRLSASCSRSMRTASAPGSASHRHGGTVVATSRIRPSNCPVLALDQPPVGGSRGDGAPRLPDGSRAEHGSPRTAPHRHRAQAASSGRTGGRSGASGAFCARLDAPEGAHPAMSPSRFGGMDHEHVRTDLGQPHGVDAPVRGMLHRQWMHGIGRHGRSASGWRGLNLGHAHSA